jgi:SAM-dependent methyltransferase
MTRLTLRTALSRVVNLAPGLEAAALVADDLRHGVRLRVGRIDSDCGTLHATLEAADSVRYIEEVFADYKRYGGVDRFHGVVAEVGPGDSAGVAMLMRGDGCDEVHLVDRYFSHRDPEHHRAVYTTLSERHRLDHLRRGSTWDERALSGVEWKIGQPAERYFAEAARAGHPRYDFIVSRAVMEHLYSPLDALTDMVRCLRPGGRVLHKIDLRDHGMFSQHHDELTFLSTPALLHRLMTRNSGRPNRVLAHRYRETLEQLRSTEGTTHRMLVTALVGGLAVEPHSPYAEIDPALRARAEERVAARRQTFADELRTVPDADLATAGVFIVVERA